MKNYKHLLTALLCSTIISGNAQKQNFPYKDASLPAETRAKDLLGRMTLEEKTYQLLAAPDGRYSTYNKDFFSDTAKVRKVFGKGINSVTSVGVTINETVFSRNEIQKYLVEKTRLGIPAIFIDEGLHGIVRKEATSFPQAIGLACSWDPQLFEKIFSQVALEGRSRGTHMVLTPVVDVCRDPRWGRVEETYGEDPYLNGVLGTACVAGFQGSRNGSIDKNHVAATLKHFVGHGQPEGGSNQSPGNYSLRVLREFHMPPFKAVIDNAKPFAIMPSYNEIDGIPAHANNWLFQDVIRKEWGFSGMIVSDFGGIDMLNTKHFIATDLKQAAELAFKAGVELDFPEGLSYVHLPELIKQNKIKESDLDSIVFKVLKFKFQMGLFENPYINENIAVEVSKNQATRQLALLAAQRSMVLLKNENNLLPLSVEKYKKIAIVGPFANELFLGGYSGDPYQKVTLLDGIKNKVGSKAEVIYSPGCKITGNSTGSSYQNWVNDSVNIPSAEENRKLIADAVIASKNADVIILAVGENEQLCREVWSPIRLGDAATLDLFGQQDELVKAISELGKPIVVYLTNGRPLSINYIAQNISAIIEGWYMGQETGTAAADILFGDVNPSGKLTITFPKSVGQIPMYYNHKPSAQSFIYNTTDNKPLFPFGFGLSYTTFNYSNLRLSQAKMKTDDKVTVSVDVTNTGKMRGDEIVQLYIHDKFSSVTRAVKELKGFERISLEAGQTKTVEFTIDKSKLAFWDINMNYVVEPGSFDIMVGTSSADVKSIELNVE